MLFASWLRPVHARWQVPSQGPARSREPGKRQRRLRLNLEWLEDRTLLSPYLVTTTADSGPGSLRDAIVQVNADTSHTLYPSSSNPSMDEIDFNIAAASDTGGGFNATTGVATITPLSGFSILSNATLINGYSQLGDSPNTHAMTDPNPSDNAVLKLVLAGSQAGTGATGLDINAPGSRVQGLVINNWGAYGIWLDRNSGSDVIAGNFVGTDINGTAAQPNSTGPQRQYNSPNGAVVVNSGSNGAERTPPPATSFPGIAPTGLS